MNETDRASVARDALHHAFLEDHQHLMRGLAAVRDRLRAGEVAAAVETADALDRQVGPHMEFEERILYPTLEPLLGKKFVGGLYGEHAMGQAAIRELVSLREEPALTAERREKLAQQVDATLEHAVSCGTLLSHLDAVDPNERQHLLEELRALRAKPVRWTEMRRRTSKGV